VLLDDTRWGQRVPMAGIPVESQGPLALGDANLSPDMPHDWSVYVYRPRTDDPGITAYASVELRIAFGAGGTRITDSFVVEGEFAQVVHVVSSRPPEVYYRVLSVGDSPTDFLTAFVAPGRPTSSWLPRRTVSEASDGSDPASAAVFIDLPFGATSVRLFGRVAQTLVALEHGPLIGTTFVPMASAVETATTVYGTQGALVWVVRPVVAPAAGAFLVVATQTEVVR
jgi:hypothetical protein